MKHSDNTGMDRLLRRFARSKGATLPAEDKPGADPTRRTGSDTHLDADEMNAYAENALPEVARSRYFAHLADCDSCRKLVTDLTLAASISQEGKARIASLETASPKSWREWLAAILSPPVLRYGLPALALFAVVIVAIIATRTPRSEAELSVAQNKKPEYATPAVETTSNSPAEAERAGRIDESRSNSNVASTNAEQNKQQPSAAATPLGRAEVGEADTSIVPPDQVATPAQKAGDLRDTSPDDEAGKRRQKAAEPTPPPPPPVQSTVDDPVNRDKREEDQKKAKAGRKDDDEAIAGKNSVRGGVANQTGTYEEAARVGGITNTRQASQPRARRSVAPKSAPSSGTPAENERSSETRSVGGRRFQKEGGAWVDTAYNPSRPTTNVRRASEQYRALIADEPTLRTIVEQLGGEVFVVWKSRAYRFY